MCSDESSHSAQRSSSEYTSFDRREERESVSQVAHTFSAWTLQRRSSSRPAAATAAAAALTRRDREREAPKKSNAVTFHFFSSPPVS